MMTQKQSNLLSFLEHKAFTVKNIEDYKNKNSILKVQCPNGHSFAATVDVLLKTNLECLMCLKNEAAEISKLPPFFLAVDAATYSTGLAFFDRKGNLLGHQMFVVDKKVTYFDRLSRIKEEIIRLIKENKIKCVILEDIQYQQNPALFKKLAMLQGVLRFAIVKEAQIELVTALADEWRSFNNILGQKRAEQKEAAKKRGKIIFQKDISEDEVEAIFLGLYGINKYNQL
jgi:Holliday junction resolvasome RuvABC endonuclease subunit